jgi:hypothetical protein
MSDEIEIVEGAIEPISNLVLPVGPLNQTALAMEEYQKLCKYLLDKNDWQTINGKKFPKRSAWRKLAVAYGVSFQILDVKKDMDEAGNLVSAEFIVRASAPNGRYADGWGACAVAERNAGRKAMHDIPATAETRAKNRAAADLFGMGEVSAEEIDHSTMVASSEEQARVRALIDSLGELEKADLTDRWKKNRLPKLEYLTDDNVADVEALIREVEYDDNEDAF